MRAFIRILSVLFGLVLLIISGVMYLQRQESSDVYWMLVQVRNDTPDYFGYYLISPDGKIQRRIHNEPILSNGRWFVGNSPDGEWIFYTKYENNRNHGLWRMRLTGAQHEQLIDDMISLEPQATRWSPDGEWLAVSTYAEQLNPDFSGSIYLVRHDGEEVREITTPETGEIALLQWLPNSESISYVEQRADEFNSYVVGIDGTDFQGQYDWYDFPPMLSPDGHSYITQQEDGNGWLLHQSDATEPQFLDIQYIERWLTNDAILAIDVEELGDEMVRTVYRYDISTSQRTVYVRYSMQGSTWWKISPNSEWIFVGSAPQENTTVLYSIHIPSNTRYDLLSDGRERYSSESVVSTANNVASFPSFDTVHWTEDSMWVIYDTLQQGQRSIFKMHPDGTDQQLLYTMTEPPYGWIQITPDQKTLLVLHREIAGRVSYDRLARIHIEDGVVEMLPQGGLIKFLPVTETAWGGTWWFIVGLAFTMIPLLLGISEHFRSHTEEKTTEQSTFWTAPYEISIFPMWPDKPLA